MPQAKDTGAKYKEHVVSSGPYMFETNDAGQELHAGPQPQLGPGDRPELRKALPDEIDVTLNVNADDIDNRLQSGDLDVDVAGTGVQPAAQGKILADPTLKAQRRQRRSTPRLWFTVDQPRRSRRWTTSTAARRSSTRPTRPATRARTAARAGGDIATNLLPPLIPGCAEVRPLPGRRRQQR